MINFLKIAARIAADKPYSGIYQYLFRIHVGPTQVKETAEAFRKAGLDVQVEGTENIYVQIDGADWISAAQDVLNKLKKSNGNTFGLEFTDFKVSKVKNAASKHGFERIAASEKVFKPSSGSYRSIGSKKNRKEQPDEVTVSPIGKTIPYVKNYGKGQRKFRVDGVLDGCAIEGVATTYEDGGFHYKPDNSNEFTDDADYRGARDALKSIMREARKSFEGIDE